MLRRPLAAATLALLVIGVATGCRVEVDVAVDVEDGGSGVVRVGVGVDQQVVAAVGDLGDVVELDDLVARGWQVTGPTEEDDGLTWVRAARRFASPAQARAVMEEITGRDGPFRDLTVDRRREPLTTRYEFAGVVDLEQGIVAFSDAALAQQLDGTPFGLTVEELEAAAGRPLEEVVDFRVAVTLPGEMASNAPVADPDRAVWQPRLGDRVTLVATGERFNTSTLAWGAVAVAAGVALLVVFMVRTTRWSRRRRARPADHPSE